MDLRKSKKKKEVESPQQREARLDEHRRKKREKIEAAARKAALGEHVRSCFMKIYILRNPTHSHPDWPQELRDWSWRTYDALAAMLIERGWQPPADLNFTLPELDDEDDTDGCEE